jgi:lipopolysaccharide export system permease protein
VAPGLVAETRMNRLDRYLIRHIAELTGIVALALLAIYTFVVFVSDVNDTGKSGFGIPQLMAYTVLMMPSSLYILMPIIALLGTMLGIGILARQSELTAMRAAGVSLVRIGAATLAAGVILGLFTVVLGDWLAPTGEHAANNLRDRARGISPSRSVWLRDGRNVVQVRNLIAEDRVGNIIIYRLDDNGRVTDMLTAESGQYLGDHWQLTNVRESHFGDGRIDVSTVAQSELGGTLSPSVLRLFILEEDNLSFHGLSRLIGYLRENHLDVSKYEILLWRKIIEPFTVMAMMLFAIPFVIGRLRDTGAGQRLLAGALVGIVFYVFNKVSLSYGALYHWPAPMAASLPTVLLAGVAVWRLTRAR